MKYTNSLKTTNYEITLKKKKKTDYLNSTINMKELEFIAIKLSMKRTPGTDGFTGKF